MKTDLLTFSEVSKVLSKRLNTAKIIRLCTKGVTSPSGKKIKLNSVKVDNKFYVKMEHLKDFIRECSKMKCNIIGFDGLR